MSTNAHLAIYALLCSVALVRADVTILTFEDHNQNSVRDVGEPLIGGLLVTAVDASGSELPFLDDGAGTYRLPGEVITSRLKIVISGYGPDLKQGKNRATTVFFVNDGDAVDVPLATEVPVDPNSLEIMIPCYEKGASSLQGEIPGFVRIPFTAEGVAKQFGGSGPDPTVDVTVNQIGSTWGVAFQSSRDRAFASALVKRHVGLGPQGLDAIYAIDYSTDAAKPAVGYFNMQGLTPSVGPPIDLGSLRRDIVDVVIDETMPYALSTVDNHVRRASYDIDAFAKVGTTGYGDIEISEDGRTLWMVNLHQRSLMSFDVDQEELSPSAAKIEHYLLEDLPGIPNLNFRFRHCINAGGNTNVNGAEAFTDRNRVAWDKNRYSTGGSFGYRNFNAQNVMNVSMQTSGPELYQTYRIGSFEYNIPVPVNEPYEVLLHFAEPNDMKVGDRVFDIMNGSQMLAENFDIVERAEATETAFVLRLQVEPIDGMLQLRFVPKKGNALLAGLEVIGSSISMSGVLRPWGLAFNGGRGYLGVVADASISLSRDHLFAYVLSFDPKNVEAGFTEEVVFPLGYPRERASNADQNNPQPLRSAAWQPWVSDWEQTLIPTQGEPKNIQGSLLCAYAQPILSEINFASDGSMVIGLMDRWAHQVGFNNYCTNPGDRTLLIGYAAGDALKASLEENGIFSLEESNQDDGRFYRKDDGPSYGGEFFYEDYYDTDLAHHGEIGTGGMNAFTGNDEVVATVRSPREIRLPFFDFGGLFSQGLHFYDANSGQRTREYLFVGPDIIGKANGLGDIEFLKGITPPSVGNFVWCDANANGVQDATDFGIDGVTITLHDRENASMVIEQQVTTNNGQYFFDDLLPNHCYELRIDISHLKAMGFDGAVSPQGVGDTIDDSNADDQSIPGFAIAQFCTGNMGLNRDDIDFGFLGPEALDAMKILCEDPNISMGNLPCADFDLPEVRACATSSSNTEVRIYPTVNDATNMTNEITSNIRVCGPDSTVYARVMINSDQNCFSISQIELMVQEGAGSRPVDFVELICPNSTFDILSYLQSQGFRGDATTDVYTDSTKSTPYIGDLRAVDAVGAFPFTSYYDDTLVVGGCGACGSVTLESTVLAQVFTSSVDSVCGLEPFDLTTVGAALEPNGSGASEAVWSTSGNGMFTGDSTLAGAQYYIPDSVDLRDGQVTLTLTVMDDPCTVVNASASLVLTLLSDSPQPLPARSKDTIDCHHPFALDPVNNDTFPGCRLVVDCEEILVGTPVDYQFLLGDCENIIKQIKRTLRFVHNKQEYFCMDTIAVRALPDTLICPPERDSVYCHTGYLKDENGHPSPLETGVPMADSIPLWPAPPSICDISIKYKDFDFHDQCPNTIRREWFIKNNCTGAFDSCVQWIMIFDTIGPTFTAIDTNAFIVATPSNSHECIAETYVPWVEVEDTCTDIKQVKAIVSGVGTVVLTYNADEHRWESHEKIEIPLAQLVFSDDFEVQNITYITYEAVDECHNKTTLDSIPMVAVDDTKPVAICDKGVNVTVSDSIIWVPAETFDEGSWDNCGVEILLARRVDWATACGVDLCDSLIYVCETEHHDSLWCAVIEADKHINPVEAHYQQALEWLCQDRRACTLPFLLGWTYDLLQYGTKDCREHPYPVDADFVDRMIDECINEFGFILPCFKALDQDTVAVEDLLEDSTFIDNIIADILKIADLGFFIGSEYTLSDIGKQIGGGWSDAVPFCCEDACQEVMVEVLAMDYWCNWSKCWTTVKVEDKTPPEVVCELFDVTVSCASYKTYYQDAVEMALEGDFDSLQSVLGRYDKVQFDPYDNVPAKTSFDIYELNCDSNLVEKDSLIYDEHAGYVWKTFSHYRAEYDTVVRTQYNGQIADDCGLICIEEKPWIDLDVCGNGRITRVFKFVGQCTIEGSGHVADTLKRTQTIWIRPDCEISKAMFEVPKDTLVYDCGITYMDDGSGNAAGSAAPASTGQARYSFDNDCRLVGIGYYDKVFRIVGGDQGCYKIIRTWCFADWCAIGGEPSTKDWWWDPYYEGKLLKCTQKIIVLDSTPPVCTMEDIPEVVETQGCFYTLDTEVQVEDECGVLKYSWKVTDTKTLEVIASGQGVLNSEVSEAFSVQAEDLPASTYSLKVSVTDDCQNESICDRIFTVNTSKKPSPVCLTSITIELNPMDRDNDGNEDTAMAVVWADEYDRSSIAACGSTQESLTFLIDDGQGDPELPDLTATSLEVGCAHIGPNPVRMYVLDQSGSWDYCEVILVVQNNMGGCEAISTNNNLVSEAWPGFISTVNQSKEDFSLDGNLGRYDLQGLKDAPTSGSYSILNPNRENYQTEYRLEQNWPNPFVYETQFGFNLPRREKFKITITTLTGQILKVIEGPESKGYHLVKVNRNKDHLPPGVLFYIFQSSEFHAMKKMILIEDN